LGGKRLLEYRLPPGRIASAPLLLLVAVLPTAIL
jgi:hypothetical protein